MTSAAVSSHQNAVFAHNASLSKDLANQIVSRAQSVSGLKPEACSPDFVRLRLTKRLNALGLPDFESYNRHLASDESGAELKNLVEALATHTTSFFREARHFEFLANTGFDYLNKSRTGTPLVVWSAASSIGAELYSAGMLLLERVARNQPSRPWELIGTDISDRVINRARSATYAADEIQGLSPERMTRFLLRARRPAPDGTTYFRLVPELRYKARFMRANLHALDRLEQFSADVIFLRNVLIYFEQSAQEKVARSLCERLRPGGYLVTGHAERLSNLHGMTQVAPSIYQKV